MILLSQSYQNVYDVIVIFLITDVCILYYLIPFKSVERKLFELIYCLLNFGKKQLFVHLPILDSNDI